MRLRLCHYRERSKYFCRGIKPVDVHSSVSLWRARSIYCYRGIKPGDVSVSLCFLTSGREFKGLTGCR
jgi:hypothetical protein